MNIIQNYHNSHTKFNFGMTIVGVSVAFTLWNLQCGHAKEGAAWKKDPRASFHKEKLEYI